MRVTDLQLYQHLPISLEEMTNSIAAEIILAEAQIL